MGAGNSGAEIGVEVVKTHPVLLAGRNVGQLPIDTRNWQGRLLFPLVWWTWEHVLTEKKMPGRKVQAEALKGHGEPLIRLKDKDISGGDHAHRRGSSGRRGPAADRGRRGARRRQRHLGHRFAPDFAWLDLPGRTSGRLDTDRGAVKGQPGLYVLGQEFQYMFNSHTVGGVGKDAAYVVQQLDRGACRPLRRDRAGQPA